MLFQWLRNKIRAAILGGVEDAVLEIEAAGPEGDPRPSLAAVLRRQLPAPPVTEAHAEEAAAVAGNGRRKKGGE